MHDMYFLPVYLSLLDSIKNQGLASRAPARALPYLAGRGLWPAGRGLWPAGRGQAPPLLYDDPRFVLEPRHYFDCNVGFQTTIYTRLMPATSIKTSSSVASRE